MTNFIAINADKIGKTILGGIKMALDNCAEDTFNETHLQALKDNVQKLSQLEEDVRNESELATNFPCQGLKTFDSDYKKALEEYRKNHNPSLNTARYQNFIKDLEDIQFAHDSQGDTTSQNRTLDLDGSEEDSQDFAMFTVDPITKKTIVNPVRSSICRHVYEKDTIEEAIRMNPRLKCPYIACRSKGYVQLKDLVEDRDLKRKLMTMAVGQPMNVDEDDSDED